MLKLLKQNNSNCIYLLLGDRCYDCHNFQFVPTQDPYLTTARNISILHSKGKNVTHYIHVCAVSCVCQSVFVRVCLCDNHLMSDIYFIIANSPINVT